MITGRDLEEFEEQNGLTHPPYRNFNDWAEEINKNSGNCLCAEGSDMPLPGVTGRNTERNRPKKSMLYMHSFLRQSISGGMEPHRAEENNGERRNSAREAG